MKVVFFGTDAFAAEILASLLDHKVNVVAVVTAVDRPKGRSLKLSGSPVKEFLVQEAPQIPILQPLKASSSDSIVAIKGFAPDLFVVVSYGQILKPELLDVPKLGSINVHPSLLPDYRGPSPVQSAVLAGEKEVGVCIIELAQEMDDLKHTPKYQQKAEM